jgi:hypothetical protein
MTGGTARRRAWLGPRLGWLGLLPASAMLLATAAAPASAGERGHAAAPARRAAVQAAPAGAATTWAQAPAGLRAAVRAALGQRSPAPGGLSRGGHAPGGSTPGGPSGTLTPADGQQDQFGFSVAVSGNTAVVGGSIADASATKRHTGAAYVFVRGAQGWVQQAKLTAADAFRRDGFGNAVAIDGNTVVVGALNRGIDALRSFHGIGGAYVFVRHGTAWSQQALLLPDQLDSVSGEFFGFSVGVSGQTVLVGATGDSLERGAVFAFTRTGTTWAQTGKFTGTNSGQSDTFGWSLAFSGPHAVVGAPQRGGFTGEAYVFSQSGTTFTQQAALVIPHPQTGDLFGRSVALSGTTALIGAPGAKAGSGAGYVFVFTGGRWTRQATLVPSDGAQSGGIGEDAVAVSGNIAVAGADFANSQTGAAYEFVRTGTHWAQKAKLTDPGGAFSDILGRSVAIAGGTALVGAPGFHHFHGKVEEFGL